MKTIPNGIFGSDEREQIEAHGLAVREAERQIGLLRAPRPYLNLDRPCRVGDGIDSVPPERIEPLIEHHRSAAIIGRCAQFVPASGAASRMFRELLHYLAAKQELLLEDLDRDLRGGRREAEAVLTFLENLRRFAFADDLAQGLAGGADDLERLVRSGPCRQVLDRLLSAEGMDYASLPKGLLKFHVYGEVPRTSFEEHLVEAIELVRDDRGICRLHLTVSERHLAPFRVLLDRVRGAYEKRFGVRYDVTFSVQKRSTDTLAVDAKGQPFRTADGRLLFRPGGHGALLENLQESGADLLLVKNIDNVAVDSYKSATYQWGRVLLGLLVDVQEQVFELLRRLDDPADSGVVEAAAAFARSVLHREAPSPRNRKEMRRLLHRPIRVCGMVPNTGEPGGGPFWVRGSDGSLSLQIVEGAQVDPLSVEQKGTFARGTHFNPVFMALGLRDHRGVAYDLRQFVDERAYIVTRKSAGGRDLVVLERPGLWNGAMAGWNTLFVDVPIEVFTPVKSVNDLLRREHQSGRARPASGAP